MPLDTGTWAIIFVAIVIAVVVGGAKLPSIMRNVGKSVSHFKLGRLEGEQEIEKLKADLDSTGAAKR